MMTIFARSTRSPSRIVKPVVVIGRASRPPTLPTATRINSSGSDSAGARPCGSAGTQCRWHGEDQQDHRQHQQPDDAVAVVVVAGVLVVGTAASDVTGDR